MELNQAGVGYDVAVSNGLSGGDYVLLISGFDGTRTVPGTLWLKVSRL
jgi:hypothetical protein